MLKNTTPISRVQFPGFLHISGITRKVIPMKQEIKYIRSILKRYAQLKRDIRAFSQVSSPVISGMPGHSYGNGTEKSMVNHVDLAYQIKQVEDALKAVEDPRYSFILNEYIINKRYSVDDFCHMWQCSKSKFNYMKNKAINEFFYKYKKSNQ